jgi:hypothetical protein
VGEVDHLAVDDRSIALGVMLIAQIGALTVALVRSRRS